jgi:hypothetical protein
VLDTAGRQLDNARWEEQAMTTPAAPGPIPPAGHWQCTACGGDFRVAASSMGKIVGCPHCRRALATPAMVFSAEIRERMRAFREINNSEFREAQDLADVFPWIQISSVCDGFTCAFCAAQNGKLLRVKDMTQAMVPPFRQCTCSERGCRCAMIPIDKYEAAEKGLAT